jgi:hypothetical protein
VLKKYELILLVAFQAKWLDRNIAKVIVGKCISNEDAREAIGLVARSEFIAMRQ